jgi:lipoteichoic acid synthase
VTNLSFPGFLRALLSRRDWVYSLSLFIPFVVYNLALKALEIASLPGDDHELAQTLNLMWSAIFFNLGYVLLWIGLFAMVRGSKGSLRRVIVFLFHAVTILVVLVTTCAYLYFQETGATLEYSTIAEWVPKLDGVEPILFLQGVPLSVWILLAAALFYATLGPLLVTYTVEWWRGRLGRRLPVVAPRSSFLVSLGLWLLPVGLLLLALGFGWLSVLSGSSSLARDPFVNVVLTGVEEASTETEGEEEATTETEAKEATTEEDNPDAVPVAEHARLTQTSQTEKRNVVLVHLESTRAQSVTPYNEDLSTTPFLNELAKSSLLAEQPYVGGAPRSTLSNISVNCGIPPPPRLGAGYHPGEVPVPCLAGLLKDQGYSTVFFSSNMDSFGDLATNNFDYQEAFAPPSPYTPTQYWDMTMDTQKYVQMSSFNYEEDIMLKPSEKWLKEHKDKPFVAEYLTGTGHYDYQCLNTRYGSKDFSENDLLNHYLNCMRLLDIFVKNLIDQYKELGLYEDTIFVIFGDHGEGLGEHGRFLHGDTIWEESLRVPLIIHAPGWFENGERIEGLASHIDVLPTVLDMLGYEVKDSKYPGYSLLHPLPSDRTLRFRCVSPHKCLASIKGNVKYIYHYNNQPEEVFNPSEDPLEKHNLADEYSKEELDRRREDLFAWFSRINAHYGYSGVGPAGEETGLQAKQSGGQPPESTVAVGQPLTVGDVEWTVTSAYPTDQLVSFYGETKRGNFIVVDFQLKNNSNDGLELSPESLALFDGNGRKYKFDTDTFLYIDSPKLIFLSDMDPGVSQEGEVIFKVPPDASQFQLELGERNPFSNKKGYVNLGF